MNKSELVQIVSSRAGINPAQAEKAVSVVIEQLHSHLPAPIASQIDNFLGEPSAAGATGGGIADKIGGMFGKK
jgi:hypothetical protein